MNWRLIYSVGALVGAVSFAASPWALSLVVRSAWDLRFFDQKLCRVEPSASATPYFTTIRSSVGLGSRVVSAEAAGGPVSAVLLPPGQRLEPVPIEPLPSAEYFLSPAANSASEQEIAVWSRRIVYRGWPFLAARYSETQPSLIGGQSVVSGAIELSNPFRGFESSQFIGHLPCDILPLGMLGNLATGAAAGALVSQSFITVRAHRRRIKGLCRACAYPLPANAGRCPECGTPRFPEFPAP